MFTEEQKRLRDEAKRADLLSVAQSIGLSLKREGKYWRIPGHSGLQIYQKDGVWVWCQMGASKGGDAISFLTSSPVGKMGFKEAVEMLTGKMWPSRGDEGSKERKTPSSFKQPHDKDLWAKKAKEFISYCHEQLMSPEGAEARRWLHDKRGLHDETIRAFQVGWNSRLYYRHKTSWGIAESGKMALPSGIVIPSFAPGQRVTGITIRRLNDAEAGKYGRYHSIPTPGGRQIAVYPSLKTLNPPKALVIVESELDAILLAQKVEGVLIASLGSAGRKPHSLEESEIFWRAFATIPIVLVALDNDEAGREATSWWLEQWKHTRAMPIPGGHKDPTEAFLAGEDLRAWVMGHIDSKEEIYSHNAPGAQAEAELDVKPEQRTKPVMEHVAVCAMCYDKECPKNLEVFYAGIEEGFLMAFRAHRRWPEPPPYPPPKCHEAGIAMFYSLCPSRPCINCEHLRFDTDDPDPERGRLGWYCTSPSKGRRIYRPLREIDRCPKEAEPQENAEMGNEAISSLKQETNLHQMELL